MKGTAARTALVFFLACILYGNSLGHGFCYDDFHSIVYNPHIRTLSNLPFFFSDPASFSVDPKQAMYRPVLLVSYALNYAVGGNEPAGYHLVDALLHGVNAALLLLLLLALQGDRQLALFTAVFFAVNPLNAETVNYVSSRSELLTATFFLSACLSYVRFGHTRRWIWYAVGVGAGILALLTKSVAVVLVGVLVLCDWLAGGGQAVRRRWRFYLVFAVVDLLYVLFTRQLVAKAVLTPVRSLDVQAWTQIKAWGYYLLMGSMPVKLSVEHQFFVSRHPGEAAVIGAGLVLISLAGLLCWKGSKLLRFACAWVAILLVPTSAVPLIVLVNEHRLYLAGIGLSLVWGWGFKEMLGRRAGVARVAIGVYTILLVCITLQRNPVWADEFSLWQDAAVKGPLMLKPHLRLGDALVQQQRFTEAEEAYQRAVALRPNHPGARNNLGYLYKQQGRWREAEEQFRTLLRSSPDNVPARLNLAGLLLRQSGWSEAEAEYRQVLEFDDSGGVAQKKLGYIALRFRGDPGLALDYYDQALALVPDEDAWCGRGIALKALGRRKEAESAYRKALEFDPKFTEAWFNLGNLYRDTRRPVAAIEAYEQVIGIGADTGLATAALEQLKKLKP